MGVPVGVLGVVAPGVVVGELELDPPLVPVAIGEMGEMVGETVQASYFLY